MNKVEIKIQALLQLMRMENNLAERETQHGDGWLYNHAEEISNYYRDINNLLKEME